MIAYFTIVCPRTVPAFTNEWNDCYHPTDVPWTSLTRGNFPTEQAACEWARVHLIHGAPFEIRFVRGEPEPGSSVADECNALSDEMLAAFIDLTNVIGDDYTRGIARGVAESRKRPLPR